VSMYSVKIIKDSLAPSRRRLTTFELRYPRFIHSELMTHRFFSRNAASSRAIPVDKMLQRIQDNPAHPIWWGANEPGMKAKAELEGENLVAVKSEWFDAMDSAIHHARKMLEAGAHKQIVNRILEPFSLITTIVTATNYENFFTLRYHEDAQPEFGYLAKLMADTYYNSLPNAVWTGFWHLPYIQADEWDTPIEILKKVSVARCARVSYLTHDGVRAIEKDLDLYETPEERQRVRSLVPVRACGARDGLRRSFRQLPRVGAVSQNVRQRVSPLVRLRVGANDVPAARARGVR
jgi:hypothetical protein